MAQQPCEAAHEVKRNLDLSISFLRVGISCGMYIPFLYVLLASTCCDVRMLHARVVLVGVSFVVHVYPCSCTKWHVGRKLRNSSRFPLP